MTYGELKATFSAILNRTDPTTDEIDECFTLGLARLARELRIPASEIHTESTIAADFEYLAVPSDLKSIIAITVNSKPLKPKPVDQFLKLDRTGSGDPSFYCRIGAKIFFDRTPSEGTAYELIYYGTIGSFADDNTETTLSLKSPDLIIAAALTYAGRMWPDERLPSWEGDYEKWRMDTQDEAYGADGPMQVQPAYEWESTDADPEGWNYN